MITEAFKVEPEEPGSAFERVKCPRPPCDWWLSTFRGYIATGMLDEHIDRHRLECPNGWKGYAAYTIKPERPKGRRVA